jgi:hypothetical protein
MSAPVIENTRWFVTDEVGQSARSFAGEVLTDEDGRPLAVRNFRRSPSDRQRIEASVELAILQRRIPEANRQHYLDFGESNPDACIDILASLPSQLIAEAALYESFASATGVPHHLARRAASGAEAWYAAYADMTGVPRRERLEPVHEDRAYLAIAEALGIKNPATVRWAR